MIAGGDAGLSLAGDAGLSLAGGAGLSLGGDTGLSLGGDTGLSLAGGAGLSLAGGAGLSLAAGGAGLSLGGGAGTTTGFWRGAATGFWGTTAFVKTLAGRVLILATISLGIKASVFDSSLVGISIGERRRCMTSLHNVALSNFSTLGTSFSIFLNSFTVKYSFDLVLLRQKLSDILH